MRAARAVAAVALVGLSVSGCRLGAALGAEPAVATDATSASVATTSPSAAPAPAVVPLAVVPGAGADDLLSVTRGEVQVGFAPPLTDWPEPCQVDDAALEYVPITIRFSGDELAGRLTVTITAATPADVGPIGVFFDDATDPYCQGDPAFPSSDTFWSHGNGGRTTAYVVLQDAVGPATPQGRPDVVSSLEIRVDDLRRHASGDAPLRLTAPTVGALCPDDDDAICVPLP
ncbi:hypothetical protein SAMN05660199_03850 [Klenkia soli]|uniref:Uncharacterized protein n=1 Tax=Klenkia soli TaxID=1052260 RepID=A0A1H0SIA2_9ACTN|nr:hypothetical protein [Klenkia soli]SDP41484.1 hypothetical protein SAMN05660199_03850 [Klenkia soli]